MVDTCPICHESSAHKLIAYVQELGPLSPTDHRSVDDKLNCGSDVSPRKHAATPRMSDKLASSARNDGLGHTMQAHDASNIQLRVLLSPVVGVHRNEMSKLGELIDDTHMESNLRAERGRVIVG
jgi:hypothetical protein